MEEKKNEKSIISKAEYNLYEPRTNGALSYYLFPVNTGLWWLMYFCFFALNSDASYVDYISIFIFQCHVSLREPC